MYEYDFECDVSDLCYRSLARSLAQCAVQVRQLAEYCNDLRPIKDSPLAGDRKLSAHLMEMLIDEIEHKLPQMVRCEIDADARCDGLRDHPSDLASEIAAEMSRCIRAAVERISLMLLGDGYGYGDSRGER